MSVLHIFYNLHLRYAMDVYPQRIVNAVNAISGSDNNQFKPVIYRGFMTREITLRTIRYWHAGWCGRLPSNG